MTAVEFIESIIFQIQSFLTTFWSAILALVGL